MNYLNLYVITMNTTIIFLKYPLFNLKKINSIKIKHQFNLKVILTIMII